jgi:hypothetical protein
MFAKRNPEQCPCFQVGIEIPMDSDDADEENQSEHGKTLLHIFERG